jgi:diguanylate cyclase (GGDEF)-like protein
VRAWRGVPTPIGILAFAGVLAATSLLLLVTLPGGGVGHGSVLQPRVLVVAALIGTAEAVALHIEFRRQTHSISLATVPLTIALLHLPAAGVMLAYLLGALIALRLVRHTAWLKTLWNLSMFAAQTGVAAWVLALGLETQDPSSVTEWLIVLGAIGVADVFSSLAVGVVIWLAEGKLEREVFAPLLPQVAIASTFGSFIAVVHTVAQTNQVMVAFGIIPLIGFIVFIKMNERVWQREQDLSQLQTFAGSIGADGEREALDASLRDLARIVRAERCSLLLLADDGSATLRTATDHEVTESDASEIVSILLDAAHGKGVVLLGTDDPRLDVRRAVSRLGSTQVLLAPVLEHDGALGGALIVGDRIGVRAERSPDEIQLFLSLARTMNAQLRTSRLREEVQVRATRDALTGLANRAAFEQRLDELAHEVAPRAAVAWIDIKGFGEINELLGPETGDEILRAVARRLRAVARPSDFIARVGGDEFALVLDCRNAGHSRRASWIHGVLNGKTEVEGLSFELEVAVGAVPVESPLRPDEVVRRATVAMQAAKRTANGFHEYADGSGGDQGRRADLYLALPIAFDRGEFWIALQPKVSTADGRIRGAEALARWTHPRLGNISPGEFMPMIAQNGMMQKLTRMVVEQATAAIVRLEAVGLPMTVSVNMTPRDLLDPGLPSMVFESLQRAGADPRRLKIEITEDSMVLDFTTTVAALNQLKEFGVTSSLDDFGTGYASLDHLHRLPVDELKIDGSFVQRLTADPSAGAIVRAAVTLAEAMSMTSVAEGVEDAAMLRQVRDLGVTEIQGYLVSRPLPVAQFEEWALAWQGQPLLDWLDLCGAGSLADRRDVQG